MSIRTELESVGYGYKKFKGNYGIEIETECLDSSSYPQGFFIPNGVAQVPGGTERYTLTGLPEWEGHVDNSLRNFGMEFVLKEPLNYDKCVEALQNWKEVLKDVKFIQKTPSTSVHVHVNFLDETFLTLGNFLTLWSLFENVFVDFSGTHRRSNLFALPIRAAEMNASYMQHVFTMTSKGSSNWNLSDQNAKYAACNLASLPTRGSIEIRSFRGTTDIEEIAEWLSMIDCLRLYAKIEGLTPLKIMKEYEELGSVYLRKVFEEESRLLQVEDYPILIERNLWYAHRLATCLTPEEWETVSTALTTLNPRVKKPARKKNAFALGAADLAEVESTVVTDWFNAQLQPAIPVDSSWTVINDLDEVETTF